jgi:hypothetical protein
VAADAAVTAATRLLHRRHAWGLTAIASFAIFMVTAIAESLLVGDAQGALGATVNLIVLVTLTLTVIGLVAAVVDTVRLRGYPGSVREDARGAHARELTAYSPGNPGPARLRASRHLHPPRHWIGVTVTWIFFVFLVALGLTHLPGLVDGIGYLSGAEATATFVPQSYGQECGRSSCFTVTHGVLQPGGTAVTLQDKVPLGQPITERRPLWAWGSGSDLIDSTASAWMSMVFSLVFMALSALVLTVATRYYLRRRRDRAFVEGWRATRGA